MRPMGRLAGATGSMDVPQLRATPDDSGRSTWTLISVVGRGDGLKVWHQHGEGVPPVRLDVEPVSSMAAPGSFGRAFVCRDCDDTTVISLPDA